MNSSRPLPRGRRGGVFLLGRRASGAPLRTRRLRTPGNSSETGPGPPRRNGQPRWLAGQLLQHRTEAAPIPRVELVVLLDRLLDAAPRRLDDRLHHRDQVDLPQRRQPDLGRAGRGQHQELERQPDALPGLGAAHLCESLADVAVRQGPPVPYRLRLLERARRDVGVEGSLRPGGGPGRRAASRPFRGASTNPGSPARSSPAATSPACRAAPRRPPPASNRTSIRPRSRAPSARSPRSARRPCGASPRSTDTPSGRCRRLRFRAGWRPPSRGRRRAWPRRPA